LQLRLEALRILIPQELVVLLELLELLRLLVQLVLMVTLVEVEQVEAVVVLLLLHLYLGQQVVTVVLTAAAEVVAVLV
jgi:hypothetical protein